MPYPHADWKLDELADVLYLFKTIQLDPNYHNNYKELARRMIDTGWNCDNDQCRHQVIQIVSKHCFIKKLTLTFTQVMQVHLLQINFNLYIDWSSQEKV